MSKGLLIALVLLLLVCCCCSMSLGGVYLLLKNADITLGTTCYKGIDNVFANRSVPCTPDNTVLPGNNDDVDVSNPAGGTRPSDAEFKTYSNSEFSFEYPAEWKVTNEGTAVIVSTPEGDSITFNHSVEESGNLTNATCESFAESSLDSFQLDVNPLAYLIGSEVETTTNGYDACVFDIDSPYGGTTTHIRYMYLVDGNKGYAIKLDATENSTLMTDMLSVADTILLK